MPVTRPLIKKLYLEGSQEKWNINLTFYIWSTSLLPRTYEVCPSVHMRGMGGPQPKRGGGGLFSQKVLMPRNVLRGRDEKPLSGLFCDLTNVITPIKYLNKNTCSIWFDTYCMIVETCYLRKYKTVWTCMWGSDQLRAGCQEVGKCSTRGESWGMYVTFASAKIANKAEPTLALKPRGDVTRNPTQGYQWPQKKDMCPPKTFKKKQKKNH